MYLPSLPRRTARALPCLAVLATLAVPAQAMTFRLIQPVELAGSGMRPSHMILGEGPIQPGDAEAFAAFMAGQAPTDHIAGVQWGIALNSPGGVLTEGVRLGEAFRDHVVTTIVLNGQSCESACAVAYLGGAAAYAVSLATERLLQPGARLGFHGIAVPDGAMAAANDTLDLARTTNAVVRDYAVRMGVEDDGLVQSLFNTPPEAMEYIDTAREILGLGVTLAVDPYGTPEGWAVNVCRALTGDILDGLRMLGEEDRVATNADRIGTVEALRDRLLAARAALIGADERLSKALAKAPADTALSVLLGQPTWLDPATLDAWEVPLDRGAGFYYDSCFAIAGYGSLTAVVVDSVAGEARMQSYGPLHGFPPDMALW